MLRLCILPNVPPSLLGDPNVLPALFPNFSTTPTESASDSFVGYLFDLVGSALAVDNTILDAQHDAKDYRTGQIVLSVAGEVVNTLRSLLSRTQAAIPTPALTASTSDSQLTPLPSSFYSAHWSKVLVQEISSALAHIPSLVDVDASKIKSNINPSHVKRALAALAVIGMFAHA